MLNPGHPAQKDTTTEQSDQVELDPFHAAIVDEVCFADAGRIAAGETTLIRLAVAHEFCMPGGPCWTWPAWVVVRAIAPGVRIREPLAAGWAVVA